MKTLGKYALYAVGALLVFFLARKMYFSPGVVAEEMAPDFTAVRADGQAFSLADLRGNFVYLEFWGSWCAPCRTESASVNFLAEQFPDLTMVSVAIERDSAAWQRAIGQLQKNWEHHVMDKTDSFKFLSGTISDIYGINKVPTHFLIDPEGRVVSSDENLYEIQRILQYHARRD